MSHTESPVVSPTATPPNTLTPTSSITLSATAARGQGRPRPRKLVAVPNPQAGRLLSFAVDMEGPADRFQLKVYAKSMAAVLVADRAGAHVSGWNLAVFAAAEELPNGIYFARVTAFNAAGESETLAEAAKLYILR